MKLEKFKSLAAGLGVEAKIEKLTGGGTRLYIPLERINGGKAHLISEKETAPLMRYLRESDVKWDYIGNYTGIGVMLPGGDQRKK